MNETDTIKNKFAEDGFAVLNSVYSTDEVSQILILLESISVEKETVRKSKDLFAIRQVLKEIPELSSLVFTDQLRKIINRFLGKNYFVVKSIYFDKPPESNWFVAYHQDLTISVLQRENIEGFSCWTKKQNQFAVQPPVDILENNFTIRIHLDDTNIDNGALKVIPGTQMRGILRTDELVLQQENEQICEVKKGGIMIMRPLLFHASNKTINATRRRVIHIEFSSFRLPLPLQWSEYMNIKTNYIDYKHH
jgi:ectoine hydroxylase-related dioxygenase (phytanoyl-CoA dioxygenase family)